MTKLSKKQKEVVGCKEVLAAILFMMIWAVNDIAEEVRPILKYFKRKP